MLGDDAHPIARQRLAHVVREITGAIGAETATAAPARIELSQKPGS
jgi:hypothetical protein